MNVIFCNIANFSVGDTVTGSEKDSSTDEIMMLSVHIFIKGT